MEDKKVQDKFIIRMASLIILVLGVCAMTAAVALTLKLIFWLF